MLDVRCSMFISFFFDLTGLFLARGDARMKLQLKANRRTAECRMSNVEVWNRCAQSFLILTVRQIKSSRQAEFIIRYSTCPQCLETAVRFLLALDLKLNDKVNPTHYAWQAGVGRSLVSHLIRPGVSGQRRRPYVPVSPPVQRRSTSFARLGRSILRRLRQIQRHGQHSDFTSTT